MTLILVRLHISDLRYFHKPLAREVLFRRRESARVEF